MPRKPKFLEKEPQVIAKYAYSEMSKLDMFYLASFVVLCHLLYFLLAHLWLVYFSALTYFKISCVIYQLMYDDVYTFLTNTALSPQNINPMLSGKRCKDDEMFFNLWRVLIKINWLVNRKRTKISKWIRTVLTVF